MVICCMFFDERGDSGTCRVLAAAGTTVLDERRQRQIADRYCRRGTFIACPLYARVERCLAQAHMTSSLADGNASG